MALSTIFAFAAVILAVFGISTLAFAQSNGSGNQNYGGYGQYGTTTNAGTFQTNLLGSNEVPPVSTTTTTGSTTVTFAQNGANTSFTLSVFNGDEITEAHLHCGNPGENGPPVVTLFSDPNGTDVNGPLASGTISDGNIANVNCVPLIGYNIANVADLAMAIRRGDIYANIHDAAHPAGVARGQLPASGNGGTNNGGGYGGGTSGGSDDHGYGGGNNGSWGGNDDQNHGGGSDGDHDQWKDDNNDGRCDWDGSTHDEWDRDHGTQSRDDQSAADKQDWNNDSWDGNNHEWNDSDQDTQSHDWKNDDRNEGNGWNDQNDSGWDKHKNDTSNDGNDDQWNQEKNKDARDDSSGRIGIRLNLSGISARLGL
jgi:hypothetical protein